MRRTGTDTRAARGTSGNGERSRSGEPTRRSEASKPERRAPSAASGEAACGAGLSAGLYLVATPIGNLADVTLRALSVLRDVDRILCEDTRITGKLLNRYRISTRLERYHDHNAEQVRPAVLAALRRGERVALVSDAGTPLVSDPGYKLVRAAVAEDLAVTTVPGPSAALAGLLLSGLPPDAFLFAGFLPPRQAARRRALARWAGIEATLLFFESAPRLSQSLTDMVEVLGNREAAVARELTKLHETVRRARLADLAGYYRDTGPPRGEIVVVVAAPQRAGPEQGQIEERLRTALRELGVRDAAAKLAAETGLPRGDLYRRALAIRRERE